MDEGRGWWSPFGAEFNEFRAIPPLWISRQREKPRSAEYKEYNFFSRGMKSFLAPLEGIPNSGGKDLLVKGEQLSTGEVLPRIGRNNRILFRLNEIFRSAAREKPAKGVFRIGNIFEPYRYPLFREIFFRFLLISLRI